MKNYDSLIVSDYDGTIKDNNNVDDIVESIKLLKMLVNIRTGFMISTGRLLQSILEEINSFDLPFDYLSCANGNLLFDKKLQLLWKSKVEDKIIEELKPYFKYILDIELKDEYGYNIKNNGVEYVLHLVENKQYRRLIVNMLIANPNFDYCSNGKNKYELHIFDKSNKTKTIELLRKFFNLAKENIYTIGDGPNDLEMIEQYNGFTLCSSKEELKLCSIDTYESFCHFIKDVNLGLIQKRR